MKQFIEWSNALSVGIDEIDNQRKLFVGMVNEMHEAIQARQCREVVGDVLVRLADYTNNHVPAEEGLMRAIKYPGYKAHQDEHQQLIRRVVEFQKKVDGGTTTIGFELMHFLEVWFTDHIMWSDQQYVEHFIEAAAKPKQRPGVGRLWQR
ncbi:bacteriohemerythrin [uncultured Thiodictyon sp.]|uniref:bacteriohemerythrin n=1 Tax=uncultured Thiodictyon sp. TaxID=1846217 RepID=UPI0025FF9949|nr:bacteriohemerythrin [uncultured Thiodictyon sp.]